jgi:hypothetical protein
MQPQDHIAQDRAEAEILAAQVITDEQRPQLEEFLVASLNYEHTRYIDGQLYRLINLGTAGNVCYAAT